ncbi:sulfurtransferase TusA family protein [Populibacterium corticicola]|uniref:Sulfurtransferase TusA family protein n=1 Tax=Populibacterium corticicola TaxID=1812826 RepID=A0ABW5XDK6_9MICO
MTTHVLDTIGLRCPIPIIKMAKMAATLQPGDDIDIVSSDPAAEYDIVSWARMKGHRCSDPVFTDDPWSVRYTVTITRT